MRHRAVEGGFLVRFDRGEKLPQGISDFCRDMRIPSATAQAIGALQEIELGYFDVATKRYERTRLEGSWELVSLTSIIAAWEEKPFAHTHVVLSGRDFSVRGGHLFEGTVSVTVEMRLSTIAQEVRRAMHPEIGLHRLDL
jgi:predicted DNA-binding protein with PD1-like motif